MLRQTHIVDVRFLGGGVWQDDRVIIKAEALHRVIAARDGEEGREASIEAKTIPL